ncbi:hypothetical protein N0V84_001692 [Fusarium piperis]|uniref:Uncharacterized protein n=1 Tax=Fusarium piperis TaxID=1435070 RepID=A0A9W8WL15_9HYPO|nr:hypothetical protein N0V84_001692 [Fusarium piperis]
MDTSTYNRQSLKRPCPGPPSSLEGRQGKRLKFSVPNDIAFRLCQDLLGVLYFPDNDDTNLIDSHIQSWASSQLSHQYSDGQGLDNSKVQALLDHLSIFIEDYLAKATSPYPTRAYLFLPSLSPNESQPYFKNRVLGETTFSSHYKALFWRLSLSERERLVAAFLKYEIMCQVLRSRVQNLEQAPHQCEDAFKEAINRLQPWEREGILCVHEYVKSLYGAIHLAYFNDMSGNGAKTNPGIADHLALFGFDLVVNLLSSTEQNQHLQLKEWFSLFEEEQANFSKLVSIDDIISTSDMSGNNETEGPGQWENLRWEVPPPSEYIDKEESFEEFAHLQRSIYRQRAWAFFDNGKMYPEHHFPAMECLQLQGRLLHKKVIFPLLPRSQRRSQKWHDQLHGVDGPVKNDAGEFYSDLEEAPTTPLPRFFDEFSENGLVRFWG